MTAVRGYRDRTLPDGTISNASALKRIVNNSDFNEELQTYAGGPQFLAFLLQDTHYARDLHHGKTLVSSAMSPVPVVGAQFRPSSGVTFYNELVYGSADCVDQIIPFQGELFINFHLPGVLLGFFLLGVSIRWLQGRFDRAPTALQAFAWQYGAIWLAFLVAGGVAGASQVFVFFFWPIYALAAWAGWRRRSLRESVPGGRDADIRGRLSPCASASSAGSLASPRNIKKSLQRPPRRCSQRGYASAVTTSRSVVTSGRSTSTTSTCCTYTISRTGPLRRLALGLTSPSSLPVTGSGSALGAGAWPCAT